MKDSDKLIIIALRPVITHGRQIFSSRWLPFLESLRELLAKTADELEQSSETLFLFKSGHPVNVVNVLLKGFAELKVQYKWQASNGALPVKLLFDLEQSGSIDKIYNSALPCWDLFQQESIYLTTRLYKKWNDLSGNSNIQNYSLKDVGDGFFRLVLPNHSSADENILFPYRDLPMRGDKTECFYCAMTHHTPADCPSKYISIRNRGLDRVGFIPLPRLNKIYWKVFADLEVMSTRLAEGIRPAELNKNDELLVFVAYLDLYRLYQPRFVEFIVFTLFSKWDTLEKAEIHVDSRNLHMALDCLRVGKYAEAEELFENERTRKNGKPFGAAIGMAFLSLERNRLIEMDHYLKKAASFAVLEKERFYCQMLLSRLHEIRGDYWAAKEAVAKAEKILPFREELRVRKLQLEARTGFNEKNMKKLRELMVDWKEMFMAILMDPHFIPVQGAVEVYAAEILNNIGIEAKNNLLALKAEFDWLRVWFSPEDQEIKEKNEILLSLKNSFKQRSYYDLLEVADRSSSLVLAWKNIHLDELKKLKLNLKSMDQSWEEYSFLWKSYKYKSFFKDFSPRLLDCKKTLIEINRLIKEKKAESISRGLALVNEAQLEMEYLRKNYNKMILLQTITDSCKIFGIYLVLSEISLGLFAVTLFFLITYLAGSGDLGWISDLGVFRNSSSQYRAGMMIIFIIAPVMAALLTIKKLRKT